MSTTHASLTGGHRVPVGARRRLVWRTAELGVFGFLALALAYFAGTGDRIGVALVLGVVGAGVLALIEPKLIAMGWLAGQPTLFVFVNNVASEVPFFTLERALFLMLLGLVVARAIFGGARERPISTTEWVVLAFLAMLTLSFATTLPGKDAAVVRSDLALLFQCYLMPWLSVLVAARLDWSERDALRLLRVLALTGVLMVAIGAGQYFVGLSWFTARYFEVIHDGRVSGTFANAVEYGSVVSGLGILSLLLVFYVRDPLLRTMTCCAAVLMFAAVLLSMSRSPLVGAAAALAFLFLRDPRIRPLLLAGGLIAAIVGSVAVPLLFDTAGLMARITEIEPIYNRLALFSTAINMVWDNPLAGVGFGRYGFADNKTDYLTGFGPVSAQWAADVGIPHLEYLHVAVLTGVIGSALYLLAFAMMWRSVSAIARRASPSPPVPGSSTPSPFVRRLAVYAQALLLSLLVNGLFVDFMAYNYFAALVYFMVGTTVAIAASGGTERGRIERGRIEPVHRRARRPEAGILPWVPAPDRDGPESGPGGERVG